MCVPTGSGRRESSELLLLEVLLESESSSLLESSSELDSGIVTLSGAFACRADLLAAAPAGSC